MTSGSAPLSADRRQDDDLVADRTARLLTVQELLACGGDGKGDVVESERHDHLPEAALVPRRAVHHCSAWFWSPCPNVGHGGGVPHDRTAMSQSRTSGPAAAAPRCREGRLVIARTAVTRRRQHRRGERTMSEATAIAARPRPHRQDASEFDTIADIVVVGGVVVACLRRCSAAGWATTWCCSRRRPSSAARRARRRSGTGCRTTCRCATWACPMTKPAACATARLSRPTSYDPDHPTFGMSEWEFELCQIYRSASDATELLREHGALVYRHCAEVPDYWAELPEDNSPKGRGARPVRSARVDVGRRRGGDPDAERGGAA